MSGFILGLDLGQMQDYTALAVLERHPPKKGRSRPTYHVRHLERPGLGTPYPAIVGRTKELMWSEPLRGRGRRLVADATGVGRPVVDLFVQAGLAPIAVTITGGDTEAHEGINFRVPKRDLAMKVQVLLQTGRLRIAEGLALGPTLAEELLNFRVKIDLRTAHDSYEAWREGMHDDLVLAVALAAWWGEKARWGPPPPVRITFRRN